MESPSPSFADKFNVPQEYAVLAFDVRRAAVSLPFQGHRLKAVVNRKYPRIPVFHQFS